MTTWYQDLRAYHNKIEEISQKAYSRSQIKFIIVTIFITFAVGIAVNILYGFLSDDSSNTKYILAIGSAAAAAGICIYINEVLLIRMINTLNEVNRFGKELQFPARIETTLSTLLFWVKHGKFEKTLSWFGFIPLISVKILLAKIIHLQLQQSFDEEIIRIHIGNYADHSKVLKNLLDGISNTCFTCIKSPRNWFKELDARNVQHKLLPPIFLDKVEYDPQQITEISKVNRDKYPSHYIHFLEKASQDVTRRRVFLLDKTQWEDLTKPENEEFYKKFMQPCKIAQVETRFVNLDILKEKFTNIQDPEREKIAKAMESNIAHQDYDIFEKSAVIVFKDTEDITGAESARYGNGPYLEFFIGAKVNIYRDLLDILFSELLDKDYGVYTSDEIETDFF